MRRQVFPRLERLCAARGSRFSAVELRSGVDEEAALDQRALPICLAEVERCKPQDVSCRVVGCCSYGCIIDRELHDLTPVTPGIPDRPLPVQEDMHKAFLYVRYNADLTPAGLKELELDDIDAERVRRMDDVDNVDDLTRIGDKLAQKVDTAHLGSFVTAP